MKIFILLLFFALLAHAENPSPEKLGSEMGARITRVPEFEFIRQEAQKLGVRVYLFGGTAAAYGHYIRQDMAREAGDKRYPDFLYDYDYTNIFRSTQDLDIVVDGSAENAQKLEQALSKQFPHFLGEKAKWEVRPLREARGDKEAILGNPDFQNQHTDSHSTGMVEVTPVPKGELAVKDVRDWTSSKPQFLQDVAGQKLHYYFNPLHETTKRAKQELNPPILSAIRYLTKAFQYDLQISGEDRTRIQKIVNEFKPSDLQNDYVQKWVEKNGKKLFQHAVDIEYAWDTLQQLGLREKLIALEANTEKLDSLAWWMSKEPLRSKTIGQGDGKTAAMIAKEKGLDRLIVAHEAKSFLAYESITRSKMGELNALISRDGKPGEAAFFGDGFYSQLGRKGATGSGFTIRMELDPRARLGTDFTLSPDKNYFVIQNRNAVRVIPEAINISLPAYFRQLEKGEEFSNDDKALLEAFRRKAGRIGLVSKKDMSEVVSIIKKTLATGTTNRAMVEEWLRLPMSVDYPEITQSILKKSVATQRLMMRAVKENSHWQKNTLITKALVQVMEENSRSEAPAQALLEAWLNLPVSADHPEILENLLHSQDDEILGPIYLGVGENPAWLKNVSLVDKMSQISNKNTYFNTYILASSQWSEHPHWEKWAQAGMSHGTSPESFISYVLSKPAATAHPEWVNDLIDKYTAPGAEQGIVQGWGSSRLSILTQSVLTQPAWGKRPEWKGWIEKIIQTGLLDQDLLGNIFANPNLPNEAAWVQAMIQKKIYWRKVGTYTLTNPAWKNHLALLEEWVKSLDPADHQAMDLLDWLLQNGNWKNDPELLRITGGKLDRPNLLKAISEGATLKTVSRPSPDCASDFSHLRP